jgi:hypothetical protein
MQSVEIVSYWEKPRDDGVVHTSSCRVDPSIAPSLGVHHGRLMNPKESEVNESGGERGVKSTTEVASAWYLLFLMRGLVADAHLAPSDIAKSATKLDRITAAVSQNLPWLRTSSSLDQCEHQWAFCRLL